VYTIGNIGPHRVVSTKLPSLGRDVRSSKISSGNTTTRLLGIFQKIDHIILVGCAGGVPHYTDYTKHPRRGDIVISYPQSEENDFVYAHFEIQKTQSNNEIIWKTWKPGSMDLYRVVNSIRKTYNPNANKTYPWEEYLNDGISSLNNEELDCRRPKDDKLFFTVGDKNVVEINHPDDPARRQRSQPMLKFGAIGGGEKLIQDDSLKQKISEKFGVAAFDSDLDQVMESIDGNRKDSFIIIRAIADYYDGTTTKEWQPYAALCAAAFMKTLLCALPQAKSTPTD
jgi:nucleoside phosphorylase